MLVKLQHKLGNSNSIRAIALTDWRLWLCGDSRTWRLALAWRSPGVPVALAWRASGARMALGTIGVFGLFFSEAQNANRPIANAGGARIGNLLADWRLWRANPSRSHARTRHGLQFYSTVYICNL